MIRTVEIVFHLSLSRLPLRLFNSPAVRFLNIQKPIFASSLHDLLTIEPHFAAGQNLAS